MILIKYLSQKKVIRYAGDRCTAVVIPIVSLIFHSYLYLFEYEYE